MKKIKVILAGIMFLGVIGINGQTENKGPQPTKDSIVYKGVTDLNCYLEVQFGSYSAGIDAQAYDKVIALIESKKLKYTTKNIGREGETRICLPLNELNKRGKKKLVEQLKKIARKGYLTSISIR